MNMKDFALVKNKQKPTVCYSYVKQDAYRKFSMFTMNSGKTFLASIEEPRMDRKWYSEFSQTYNSIDECLAAFTAYLESN